MKADAFVQLLERLIGIDETRRCVRKFGSGELDEAFFGDILTFEALALYVYSNASGWYLEINRQLWSGEPSIEARSFADVVDAALRKLPALRGQAATVYRGLKVADPADFFLRHGVGDVVTFLGLTSAAYRREMAYGGNVLFIIRSQNARSVWHFAPSFVEEEVLFPTRCRFRVLESDMSNGQVVALLEEIDPT